MHSILLRQMKKLKLYRDTPPDHAAWQLFLDRVDAAYTAADEERYTLERSLKVSSEEMQTLYQQLKTSSEARIRAIADALPDLLFLIDEDGLYLEVFAAASIDKLYKAPEDLKGKRLTDVLPPDLSEKFMQVMHSSLDEGEVQVADYTLDVPSGRRSFEARFAPSDLIVNGRRTLVCLARDMTDTRDMEARTKLIGQVVQAATEGVVILDMSRNVVSVNPAYETMFGVAAEDVLGAESGFCTDAEDPGVYDQIWSAIDREGSWQGELIARRSNGETFPLWLTLDAAHMQSNRVTHYVALLTDISEIKQSRSDLEYIATHDSLTELPNRILFLDRLQQAVSRSLRNGAPGAVLFLDLDRFKVINDSLGHAVGDELLKDVARRLSMVLRSEDTLARLGGDEFTVIVEQLENDDLAEHVARKVLDAFKTPFQAGDYKVEITTSVGISMFPQDGTDVDTLTKQADIAMYSAKEAGRNRFRHYTQELSSSEFEFFSMEQDLRKAMPNEELSLVYQPQYELTANKLIGFEALLRWRSPQRGKVEPGVFIPVAEVTGLIESIGSWVLEEVCRQIVAWKREGWGFGRIAVNLSRRQLASSSLVPTVKEMLKRYGIDGSHLEFEITESSIIEQDDIAFHNLQAIHEMDIELAIDDFGTGHSSLVNLKRFPLSRLKIDRTFVKDVNKDANDEAIIKATIALGQSLGMKVIAEGVETRPQLDFLREAGCDEVQGYLFGKPVSARETETLLGNLTVV
jgi:diguanylate cyclase (GGDEF)-like protein/PAS domain S-box-containing protein